jgi:thiosulfate dehydrogenase [quinone] large subunit
MAETDAPSEPATGGGAVVMDEAGDVRLNRPGAVVLSLMRIGLGLVYLWAFFAQGFGIQYSNSVTDAQGNEGDYGWHFDHDSEAGWISSGFSTSPTEGYVGGAHGPTAFIPQELPVGVDDFGWMFAIGGLGIALTFGIAMRIAGWGGFILNMLIWFAGFPPSSNPLIDGEHMMFALALLLFMFLHAGNHWGLGRWWTSKAPGFLH